jgi:RNA polymerase sigma-70 factor (ECF subfamily)
MPAGEQERPASAGPQVFATTHWSVVITAGQHSSPNAQEALEMLCRTYWYPLYAYVRRLGNSPEDAQDLTQAFFAWFLERSFLQKADRQRGRFRSFLLSSLNHFLSHERERAQALKRGGGQIHIAWDLTAAENRYHVEPRLETSPEKTFDQRWALALFQQALGRLRLEYATPGKRELFEQLKPFLTNMADDGGYEGVAARLGMAPGSVAVAVHRLRQRYGELVKEEIAHTVASPTEVQDELRYLIELVGGV